jgi:hypothetical protein
MLTFARLNRHTINLWLEEFADAIGLLIETGDWPNFWAQWRHSLSQPE